MATPFCPNGVFSVSERRRVGQGGSLFCSLYCDRVDNGRVQDISTSTVALCVSFPLHFSRLMGRHEILLR